MTLFADLNLNPKVLKAVIEAGYETPTPIQLGAIPPALEGRDVLGIAQTGTGKTASFVLPMITRLARGRARARMPRSLVLAPTRELAAQVAENFDTYSKHLKLTKALLIGGVSFKEQDVLIDRGVDVLIATPGRLLDHFERGKLLLTGIEIMVVDEADRMLDMGFIPDIERIFSITPPSRQTLFFSATMAPEIERVTKTFLREPAKVEVARRATTAENIAQTVILFRASRRDRAPTEKRRLLRAMIDGEGEACTNAIVFCNRKTEVDVLAKSLKRYGYDAAPIHGDLDQSQRTRTLDGFRSGDLRFLVASDVAARGLDIPAVSHIFNYDVPSHAEDYVHRIGRTGRAGRSGKAMMICSVSDERALGDIEKLVGNAILRGESPLGDVPVEAEPEEVEAPTPRRAARTRTRRVDAVQVAAVEAPAPVMRAAEVAAPEVEVEVAPEPVRELELVEAGEGMDASDRSRRGMRSRRGGRSERAEDRRPARAPSRRDEGGSVVGMGDHLPSFIEKSFEERLTG